MAIKNLSKRTTGVGFEYSETIATGANGDTVLIPGLSGHEKITCTLIAGGNTGKFQFTTSPDAAVIAGSGVTWQDWDNTTNTGTVTDVLAAPVTAVRGVSTSGEVKIELVY